MASVRQIASNRRNAGKSTGPQTEEGKGRSRANALKHGLAGDGVVRSAEDDTAISERMNAWRGSYTLATAEQEWLFEGLVVESVRVDRCRRDEAGLRTYLSDRAAASWEVDRRLVAEELGASLARKPALTVARLGRTRQGCDWMLERWEGLGSALAEGRWDEAQTALAFDLRGIPTELRNGEPWKEAGSPEGLVEREVARLDSRLAEALEELDEVEREAAEAGLEVETSRSLATLRRYEARCFRQYQAAREQLMGRPGALGSRLLVPMAPVEAAEPAPPPEVAAPCAETQETTAPPPDAPEVTEQPARAFFDVPTALHGDAVSATPRPMNRKMRRAAMRRSMASRVAV